MGQGRQSRWDRRRGASSAVIGPDLRAVPGRPPRIPSLIRSVAFVDRAADASFCSLCCYASAACCRTLVVSLRSFLPRPQQA